MSPKGSAHLPVQTAVSAGGVVYRTGPRGMEVVLCGRDSDGVWGLPKGTPAPGESLEQTALREVSEETGLQVRIVEKIGTIQYWFSRNGVRYHKWVHHYLMQAVGGDTKAHDIEYDRVEWFPAEAAAKVLSYKNEAKIVEKARSMVEERT